MASYIPSTQAQRQEMLRTVGVADYRDLYRDVPAQMYLDKGLDIPEGLSELEVSRKMTATGPEGMAQAATQSMSKAHYLTAELCKLPGVSLKHSGAYFHEFITLLPKADEVLKALEDNDILGGLPVEGGLLWCVTEKVSRETLDKVAAIVKEVLACG